jgi:DNA-binding IclR family transcriptional regulator
MVYIEHCRGSETVTLRLDVGSHLPIATTSMGRAFLAALPEAERDYLLAAIKQHAGDDWPTVRRRIEQAQRDIADRGCCFSIGEWEKDVNGAGVPLISPDGSTVMAFNCGGPSFVVTRHKLETDLGPRLVDMVRGIETMLVRSYALEATA